MRTEFHVKYVNGTNVYIDAGRNAGLDEGTKVVLKQAPAKSEDTDGSGEPGIVARLTVVSVASSSAVCQVDKTSRDLVVGDVLSLPDEEVEQMVAKNAIGTTRVYPMVVSFSEGDPAGRGGARRRSPSAAAGDQPVARPDRVRRKHAAGTGG